ncbi:MAG: FHA domain-containing protein [Saprospiraceae bacterium]|nr:FHA domain-containing protein [Saprospiraceae bacterium]
MKKEVKSIIINHKLGSKVNQIEEFNFNSFKLLTIGRDASSSVQFDPEADVMVSRKHAVIKWSDFDHFQIEDLGSTNGVYVNDKRITETTALHAGDTVQFGNSGPAFQFELNPRPSSQLAPTEMIQLAAGKATEELIPMELHAAATPELKETIGKQTFERAIYGERSRASRAIMSAIAGLVIVFAAAGFAFKDQLVKSTTIIQPEKTITDYFDASKIAAANTNKVVLSNSDTSSFIPKQVMMFTTAIWSRKMPKPKRNLR